MTRRHSLCFRWSSIFLVLIAPTVLSAQDNAFCAGYDNGKRVVRFGSNAVSSESAETAAEFSRLMQEHRSDLEAIMRDRGLGDLIDELFAAAASGNGVEERNLARGEELAWMASRKDGEIRTGGPVCLDLSSSEGAWEVTIRQESVQPAVAECQLRVTSDCGAGTITVDASGSSAGVDVTMSGGGRSTSLLASGSKTWTGDFDDPFGSDYSFAATARANGVSTTTIHTFVIPKTCLNLAYKGEPEVVTEQLADSCTQTAQIQRCDAASPACSIELSETAVRTRREVEVSMSGHWDSSNPAAIVVPVTAPDGSELAQLTSFPSTLSFPTPGTYTFNGTAINEAGESRECSAEVVVDPRYTVRVSGLNVAPDANRVILPTPVALAGDPNALSQFILHSGTGIGGDFEYHFSPRLGLNFSLDWAELDLMGQYDSSFVWEMGDEQMSYLSFTVGPNFHLTPGSRADFYLGLFVGASRHAGRVTANLPSASLTLDLGGSFVYGGLLGLDIGLGVRQVWALHLGIRQEILEADGVDVDPFLFEAGVARRF